MGSLLIWRENFVVGYMQERTISHPVDCVGLGLHTGQQVNMRLSPAPLGHGIQFLRTDMPEAGLIPALSEFVTDTSWATTIAKGRVSISTIEHLMAALHGLRITNLLVEVDGPELPVMDGSAKEFVSLIKETGMKDQGRALKVLRLLRRVEFREGDRWASLEPSDELRVDFTIDFAHPLIGRQRVERNLVNGTFEHEFAGARTFGFLEEVNAMKAAGFAKGGSLDNAIVVGQFHVMNEEGLRFSDEFVRHKALDAIGDIYLLGAPVMATYQGHKAGHYINHRLVSEVLANPDCYEIVDYDAPITRPQFVDEERERTWA